MKSCVFVRNKSIIKTAKIWFLTLLSPGTRLIVWIRRELCTDQAAFKKIQKIKTSWYFCFSTSSSLLHTMLIDGLERCGLLVLLWCFYQLLDSHSDGTHSLQRIHCWASDGMQRNSSKSLMVWWGIHFQLFVIVGWTIPLKTPPFCCVSDQISEC